MMTTAPINNRLDKSAAVSFEGAAELGAILNDIGLSHR
jgi:hypothetical protein